MNPTLSCHVEGFFNMLRVLLPSRDFQHIILSEFKMDKIDGVREFTFGGFRTKWMYAQVNGRLYSTLPMRVEHEPVIINLLDHDETPEEKAKWANVIGQIARYPHARVLE